MFLDLWRPVGRCRAALIPNPAPWRPLPCWIDDYSLRAVITPAGLRRFAARLKTLLESRFVEPAGLNQINTALQIKKAQKRRPLPNLHDNAQQCTTVIGKVSERDIDRFHPNFRTDEAVFDHFLTNPSLLAPLQSCFAFTDQLVPYHVVTNSIPSNPSKTVGSDSLVLSTIYSLY